MAHGDSMVAGGERGGSTAASMEGLPADARCLACGYSLLHLLEARCPECGRGFDPGDVLSFEHADRRRLAFERWCQLEAGWREPEQLVPLIAWAVVAVGVTLTERLVLGEMVYRSAMFWAGPPLVLAWVVRSRLRRWILGARVDRYASSERRVGWWHWVFCLCLMTVFSFQRFGGCEHGARCAIGPLGWGYSTVGSPCNAPGIRYWNVGERWYVWCGEQYGG